MPFSAIHIPSLCGAHCRGERTANAVRVGEPLVSLRTNSSELSLLRFGWAGGFP